MAPSQRSDVPVPFRNAWRCAAVMLALSVVELLVVGLAGGRITLLPVVPMAAAGFAFGGVHRVVTHRSGGRGLAVAMCVIIALFRAAALAGAAAGSVDPSRLATPRLILLAALCGVWLVVLVLAIATIVLLYRGNRALDSAAGSGPERDR